ncbi:MAG: A/G-specific adenine glycosylase [Candidatus Thalassarchaeaceae archaeon]|jgi:A/G-specific adenine glycosylase|nr:A/G-specific adenine glycosylase [Candidatus Thalassarchaeaceae archaeon]
MREMQEALLSWFDTSARPLPWRQSKCTPWDILLAEIILQQTRMETGLRYWELIRKTYPSPASMAAGSQEDLLRLWQGCGYYARARNLHRLATEVGTSPLPNTYEDLLSLPGVGPYTASAVASIAFEEAVACVDGNVRRVISRLNATHMSDAEIQGFATQFLSQERPGDWNEAIMELGSLICTPRNPQCDDCPLKMGCQAVLSDHPTHWPAKRSTKQRHVEATALVIGDGTKLVLEERKGRTLGGLWGLPFAEGKEATTDLLASRGLTEKDVTEIGHIRHDFTHKRLQITVLSAKSRKEHELIDPTTVPISKLDEKVIALHQGEQS